MKKIIDKAKAYDILKEHLYSIFPAYKMISVIALREVGYFEAVLRRKETALYQNILNLESPYMVYTFKFVEDIEEYSPYRVWLTLIKK